MPDGMYHGIGPRPGDIPQGGDELLNMEPEFPGNIRRIEDEIAAQEAAEAADQEQLELAVEEENLSEPEDDFAGSAGEVEWDPFPAALEGLAAQADTAFDPFRYYTPTVQDVVFLRSVEEPLITRVEARTVLARMGILDPADVERG